MNIVKTFAFQVLKNQRNNFLYHHARPFFCQSFLKLASFQEKRKTLNNLFLNPDEYKSRLKGYLTDNKNSLIFCDDIVNMMAFTNSDEDIEILKNLLIRISLQEVTAKRFVYGPEVMRLLHILNKPAAAVSLIENDKLFHFFNNLTSCAVLLDLLWENQMYHKIIHIFQMYAHRCSNLKESYNINALFFCACYKENTPKAYHAASVAYDNIITKKLTQCSVIKLFFSALAFKQNHLNEAMELLVPLKLHCTALNTKLLILARNQRFFDVIQNIENMAFGALPSKRYLCTEVLEMVKKEMMDTDSESLEKLQKLEEKLPKNFLRNMSFDDLLFKSISSFSDVIEHKEKLMIKATSS